MSVLEVSVSTKNSTVIPLGIGEEFVGDVDDLSSFQEVDITVAGAPAVAPGLLTFEFSPDGINWDVSAPRALSGPNAISIPLRVVLPRFRVRYANNGIALTALRITTVFHRTAAKSLTRFLDQEITAAEPTEVVRSVLAAERANGSTGNVVLDDDGRLRVAVELLTADVSTETTLALIKERVDNLDVALSTLTNPSDVQPVTGPLTDAELRAAPVRVLDAQAASDFHKLLKLEPKAGEEIRRDETNTDDYHGAAPDGTATSAAAWKVCRIYKTVGQGSIVRVRYRTGVVWDDRAAGW